MKTVQGMLGPSLALAGLLVAGGLSAQQPGQGMGPGMGAGMGHMGWGMGHMGMPGMYQHMGQMAGIHAYAPAALLEQATDLGLTREQVTKLEALATDTRAVSEKAFAEHNVRHDQIAALFKQPAPDAAKARELGQAAMQAMIGAHSAELAASASAKGLLTDAQRAKVDAWVADHPMHWGPGEKGGKP